MLQKIQAIVLQTIRHNDRNDIVTLFTRQRGRVAVLSPTGAGKSARMRRARLSPLSLIETEINFREARDLQFLGTISTLHPWRNLYFDPMKSSMIFFMAEFLNKILRTAEADTPMWQFLLHSIHTLDNLDHGIANYHLAFLIRLLPIVGIAPDLDSYEADAWFDLVAGQFTILPPAHTNAIMPSEARLIPLLMRINFRNMHRYRFNVDQRRRLLRLLLRYYSLHLPVPETLTSLQILSEL